MAKLDIKDTIEIPEGIKVSIEGTLVKVNIIGIRLSKSLPGQLQSRIESLFIRDTKRILLNSRWTPYIHDGAKLVSKREYELKFELE